MPELVGHDVDGARRQLLTGCRSTRRLKKMEAERLQEASGDKLDEEAKARRKKCAFGAMRGVASHGGNTSFMKFSNSYCCQVATRQHVPCAGANPALSLQIC